MVGSFSSPIYISHKLYALFTFLSSFFVLFAEPDYGLKPLEYHLWNFSHFCFAAVAMFYYQMVVSHGSHRGVNSLWPRDGIWRHRSLSTLVQVIACCLTVPSHHLNQCWLRISEVLWHSYECCRGTICDSLHFVTTTQFVTTECHNLWPQSATICDPARFVTKSASFCDWLYIIIFLCKLWRGELFFFCYIYNAYRMIWYDAYIYICIWIMI